MLYRHYSPNGRGEDVGGVAVVAVGGVATVVIGVMIGVEVGGPGMVTSKGKMSHDYVHMGGWMESHVTTT